MENKASYRIVTSEGTGEIVEKKSRFIGSVFSVNSVEEAEAKITEQQKKYWDARHNCYAFVIGVDSGISRCSDNGEPSGTAGKPILEVIKGAGITNILIVVTRYFGGVLLGTGGLVRAYTQAAQAGLAASVTGQMIYGSKLHLTADYNLVNNIQYYLRQEEIPLMDETYTDKVEYDIVVKNEDEVRITDGLTQKTEGKIIIEKTEEGYYPF
ncbi:YigZ family protein [Butyrivibrio sp. WCD3002]|uniref:YigZ family protein n=1 Tax=Butyrivibrio sp. WCD3002 TaxID=1280676 RepID=UPI000429CFED|nr:YigZ family protein [Butyrivibrio sp. WCD3002]